MAEVTIFSSTDSENYKDALIQIPLGVYAELCVKVATLEYKHVAALQEMAEKLTHEEDKNTSLVLEKWKLISEVEALKKELEHLKSEPETSNEEVDPF